MDLISGIRQRFGFKAILQAAKDNTRKKRYLGIEEARTIGILYEWSQAHERSLSQILKTEPFKGRDVHILGYRPAPGKAEITGPGVFSRKDVNWMLLPSDNAEVSEFLSRDYDILLDITPEDYLPLLYVLASSKASLSVSLFSKNKKMIADLLINLNGSPELEIILKHMTHYLHQIQSAP